MIAEVIIEHEDDKNIITTSRALELDRCLKLLHIKKIKFELRVKENETNKIYYEIEMFGQEAAIDEAKKIFETIIS